MNMRRKMRKERNELAFFHNVFVVKTEFWRCLFLFYVHFLEIFAFSSDEVSFISRASPTPVKFRSNSEFLFSKKKKIKIHILTFCKAFLDQIA